jgi:hypothetical protein
LKAETVAFMFQIFEYRGELSHEWILAGEPQAKRSHLPRRGPEAHSQQSHLEL